jgi:methionyl-tRNA formyltransferase
MGTPEFAAASLRSLLDFQAARVLAVYCQPDRPAGRGKATHPGPVKRLALDRGLPVRQPQHFKTDAEVEALASLGADIFVVAAYGLILPQAVLDIPPLGALNVHASLLPELRGAAPIQRAVISGAQRTGISIMRMELRLDSGPVLLQRALGIGFAQSAGELHDELALLGGKLLTEALARLGQGGLAAIPQDEARATYAPKLEKNEGLLDFRQPGRVVHNLVRGVTPWPGARLRLVSLDEPDRPPLSVIVRKGRPLEGEEERALAARVGAGAVLPLREGLLPVACADGLYAVERLKPDNGREMAATDFAGGYLKSGRWLALAPPLR